MTRAGLEPATYGLKDHFRTNGRQAASESNREKRVEVGRPPRSSREAREESSRTGFRTGLSEFAGRALTGSETRHRVSGRLPSGVGADRQRAAGSVSGWASKPSRVRPNKSLPGGLRGAEPPASLPLGSDTLGKNTSRVSPTASSRKARDVAFDIRDGLRGFASVRCAKCGRVRIADNVEIAVRDKRAHYHGVMRCGSVWECPVCAMMIKAQRAEEVRAVIDWHGEEGVQLLTLTVRHEYGGDLATVRRGVAIAYRRLLAGAPWQRVKERFRVTGLVRAMELTHGANGWHPHLHALLLTRPLSAHEALELRDWFAHRWRKCVRRVLGDTASPTLEHGCDLRVARQADYITKLGLELTAPAGKVSRLTNRSPLDIAQAFLSSGDESELALWQEYAAGMKGARMLTWSHGLRNAVGLGEERTDEEIVEGEDGSETLIATIAGADWDDVRDISGAKVALLTAAENGGSEEVYRELSTLLGRPIVTPSRGPHSDAVPWA